MAFGDGKHYFAFRDVKLGMGSIIWELTTHMHSTLIQMCKQKVKLQFRGEI